MKKAIIFILSFSFIFLSVLGCKEKKSEETQNENPAIEEAAESSLPEPAEEPAIETLEDTLIKSLPKSGATKFITNSEDYNQLIKELENPDIYNDKNISTLGQSLSTVNPFAVMTNFLTIMTKSEKLYIDSKNIMMGRNIAFNETGTYSMEINEKHPKIYNLPEGINLSIPSVVLNVNLETDLPAGKGKITAKGDSGYTYSTDLFQANAQESILKGLNSNGSVFCDISADINSSSEINEDFFYYMDSSTTSLSGKIAAEINAGTSFCTETGLGGNALLSMKANFDDTISYLDLKKLIKTLNQTAANIEYGIATPKDFETIPLNIDFSFKFYDDENKETYCVFHTTSLYELYDYIITSESIL